MLTSVQEAAFNAAGEAMSDLPHRITISRHSTIGDTPGKFFAFGPDPRSGRYDTVHGTESDTLAGAVQSALDAIEAIRNAPPKLVTAKEAVDAVKAIVSEELCADQRGAIDARIDALPLA